jgi:hypothetical protein
VYAFAAYASLNANLERIASRAEAQAESGERSQVRINSQSNSRLVGGWVKSGKDLDSS